MKTLFYKYKRYVNLVLLWLPIIIYRTCFWISTTTNIFPDSYSYMTYPFSSLIMGRLSARTPVYPFVIRVFLKIMGEAYYLEGITIFQSILSFVAVVYLYKICKLFSLKKLFTIVLVYLYGLNTSVIGWDRAILTESIALSLIVISFYYTFDFIKRCSLKSAIIAQVIVFIMVFERPSSVIYWLMINCFLTIFGMKNKIPKLQFAFLTTVITSLIIIVYMTVFYQQFGIFSLTDAVPRQHLIVIMEKGYYKSSSDKVFKERIESLMKEYPDDAWTAMGKVLGEYGNKKISKLTKECYQKNIKDFTRDRFYQIYHDANYDYISAYLEYKENQNNLIINATMFFDSLFRINVKNTFIIFMIIIALLVKEILDKKIKWINIGLFVSMFGTFYITYYGTCAEYPRTMLCVVPISYIALVYILNQCNSLNGEKDCLSFGRRK